ncbi:MAG: PetM family cytochrome b6-f complex subunit 7 [Cyanobacteria bacterium P01_F01_bin.53]
MGGEIFSTGVLVASMIMVGLGLGFLLLKVQGAEE